MKKSYFDVGRKLTDEEYLELRTWAKEKPELSFKENDVREDGKVFVKYSRDGANGEYWTTPETLQSIKDAELRNRGVIPELIKPNPNGVTFLKVGRRLTEAEQKFLDQWRLDNPELTWKKWNQHPEIKSLFFNSYSKDHANGERWQKNKYHEDACLINRRQYKKREIPLETNKKSYFSCNALLTDEQWIELVSFNNENPNLKWNIGEDHPLFENIVFLGYSQHNLNGEYWTTKEIFLGRKSRARETRKPWVKLNTEQKKAATDRDRVRRNTNQIYKIKGNISSLMRWAFRNSNVKKSKRTEEVLGCSIQEFKEHIEKQFEPWMTWENQGKFTDKAQKNTIWQLDHFIPISMAKSEEEIILLNHYLNFRPLCAHENQYVKRDNPPPPEEILKTIQNILTSKQNKIISDMQNKFSQAG